MTTGTPAGFPLNNSSAAFTDMDNTTASTTEGLQSCIGGLFCDLFLTLVAIVTLTCAAIGFLSIVYLLNKAGAMCNNYSNSNNNNSNNNSRWRAAQVIVCLPKKALGVVFSPSPATHRQCDLDVFPTERHSSVYQPVTQPLV